ncbi:hypothetical protein KR067_006248 [Drosophila pandora]|nr:hypothetical protein KR067_006248 [Drosophila pandora]
MVFRVGNMKFIVESLKTSCDHDYVEYFEKVPNSEMLYTFRVVKLASAFTIDVVAKVMKTQRIMYKLVNISGCEFLGNPILYKAFDTAYKKLVVNGSFFKCPIKPNVYFLKNDAALSLFPSFHPPGRFQLSMRVKMRESRGPFVMEMLWKYKIVRL